MPDPDRSEEYLESLERGLRVLALFGSGERSERTMIEVAEELGIPRASARRVLFTLEHMGYLRSDGRAYSLAPKVLSLGYGYLAGRGFRAVARPVLESLVTETGHTCSIGVLDGDDVAYVLRAEARRMVRIDLSVGSRIPACHSSMGRVLLGGLDDTELRAYLARVRPQRLTRYTVTDRVKLRRLILEARREGWSYIAHEIEEGICGLATALHDAGGKVIAAVNVSLAFQKHSVPEMRRSLLPVLLRRTSEIENILRSGVRPD